MWDARLLVWLTNRKEEIQKQSRRKLTQKDKDVLQYNDKFIDRLISIVKNMRGQREVLNGWSMLLSTCQAVNRSGCDVPTCEIKIRNRKKCRELKNKVDPDFYSTYVERQ